MKIYRERERDYEDREIDREREGDYKDREIDRERERETTKIER